MKIAILVGTRPEAIKLIPLYLELKSRGENVLLVSTGQHKEMLHQIFTFFEIRADVELEVMKPNQSLAGLSALVLSGIDAFFKENPMDLAIVQGDTTTAFCGALAAFYNKIKIAHIEAGLRTHDKYSPFPEEVNRQLVGCMADYHFAPTEISAQNLRLEGKKNIHTVGNTVIDALLEGKKRVEHNIGLYQNRYAQLLSEGKKLILVTGHRRESFGEGFENICSALSQLAEQDPTLQLLYPVHLNPNVKTIVEERLGKSSNIALIPPVGYGDMIYLMSQAYLILTDSGGIQEEAPALNKPVIVMRNTTERPEGIDAGCALLAGNSKEGILEAFQKINSDSSLYQKMAMALNPYGNGTSAKKIVDILLKGSWNA
jgi:UDP-N-acetylglucosamine 2-epimerase (non-hydrolysing)